MPLMDWRVHPVHGTKTAFVWHMWHVHAPRVSNWRSHCINIFDRRLEISARKITQDVPCVLRQFCSTISIYLCSKISKYTYASTMKILKCANLLPWVKEPYAHRSTRSSSACNFRISLNQIWEICALCKGQTLTETWIFLAPSMVVGTTCCT